MCMVVISVQLILYMPVLPAIPCLILSYFIVSAIDLLHITLFKVNIRIVELHNVGNGV